MSSPRRCWMIAVSLLSLLAPLARAVEPVRTLPIHVVQASGQSNYTFLRANFRPGEIEDPWSVRFFDPKGQEIEYFVWDAVDWQTAREGRSDWGHQYPLLQHYPGNDPGVKKARVDKIAWARKFLPAEGVELEALEQAARASPRSQCVVLYLLRYRAAPYAKDRLTMKVFAEGQIKLLSTLQKDSGGKTWLALRDLAFSGFPQQPEVMWKGKPVFRYCGFNAGGTLSNHPHVQDDFEFTVTRGIVTKVELRSRTDGRQGGKMKWDCSYIFFPEGCYVALEGFSLEKTAGYLGGVQQMSILEAAAQPEQRSAPTWSRPWYVQQIGADRFAAFHLFTNAPLTAGHDNNPFIVGSDKHQAPVMELDGTRMALTWHYQLIDKGVFRMFAPQLAHALAEKAADGRKINTAPAFLQQAFRTGKVTDVPRGYYTESPEHLQQQVSLVRWRPDIDWLYRQYAVGISDQRDAAEKAVAHPVCAAGGWIDRPWTEERLARIIVDVIREWGRVAVGEDNCTLQSWTVHLLLGELTQRPGVVRAALKYAHPEPLSKGRAMLERVKAAGIDPRIQKTNECLFGNPAYHSSETPRMDLLLEYFGHDKTLPEFRQGLLEWADYILPLMAGPPLGKEGPPLDWNAYRESYMGFWPSRTVLVLPTFLYAQRMTKSDVYKKAAVMMFDDLCKLQDANPLGHWNCWTFRPDKGGRDYDTVYLGATLDRGLWDWYAQKQLKLCGPERMSRLVTALCRSTLVGHKLADNGECDNFACEASYHGGHPQTRVHAFLMLQDDFDFYKGLVGDMVRMSALAPEKTDAVAYRWLSQNRQFIGHGTTSPIMLPLMWALGIYTGERPQQARLQVTKTGWQGAIKNAVPGSHAELDVRLGDLQPELNKTNRPLSQRPVWRVTVLDPTFRTSAKVEVGSTNDCETLRTSHTLDVFYAYPQTHADWSDTSRLAVIGKQDAQEKPVDFSVRDGGIVFRADKTATYQVSYR